MTRFGHAIFPLITAIAGLMAACTDTIPGPDDTGQGALVWTWQHPPVQIGRLSNVWGHPSGVAFVVGNVGTALRYRDGVWERTETHLDRPLTAVHGVSPDDVMAVGYEGSITRFNGHYWLPMLSGIPRDLLDVWMFDSSQAIAVGEQGTILRWRDGRWSEEFPPTSKRLETVWAMSPNDIYVGGRDSFISHYDGVSWQHTKTNDRVLEIRDLWGSGAQDIWAAGTVFDTTGEHFQTAVLHYDGTAWTVNDTVRARTIWGRSADDIYAADYAVVRHYDGSTWSPIECGFAGAKISGTSEIVIGIDSRTVTVYDGGDCRVDLDVQEPALRGVWGAAPDDVWAVGFHVIMHYDGSTWQKVDTGFDIPYLWSIHGRSRDDVLAVGGGQALTYDGTSWSAGRITPDFSIQYGLWRDPDSDFDVAVGSGGRIWQREAGTWTQTDSVTSQTLFDVWGASARDIYAVGWESTVLRYDGQSWAPMSPAPPWDYSVDVRIVGGTSPTNIHFIGGQQLLHLDESVWTSRFLPDSMQDAWEDMAGTAFLVGRRGVILQLRGGAIIPQRRLTDDELSAVWGTSADDVFAVGSGGAILHYGATR